MKCQRYESQLFISTEVSRHEYDLVKADGKIIRETEFGYVFEKRLMLPGLQVLVSTKEPPEQRLVIGNIRTADIWYDSGDHSCVAVFEIDLDHTATKAARYSVSTMGLPGMMAKFKVAELSEMVGKTVEVIFNQKGYVWSIKPLEAADD